MYFELLPDSFLLLGQADLGEIVVFLRKVAVEHCFFRVFFPEMFRLTNELKVRSELVPGGLLHLSSGTFFRGNWDCFL